MNSMEDVKIEETQTNLIRKEIAEKLYAVIRPLLVEELSSHMTFVNHKHFIFVTENFVTELYKKKWTGLLPIMKELINDLIRSDKELLLEAWTRKSSLEAESKVCPYCANMLP